MVFGQFFRQVAQAAVMEPNILCSEDESSPAVKACFCRFPLPLLCYEHLSKHPTDTDHFVHFHLPLGASHLISSDEIKEQWTQWLFRLHSARVALRKNLADIEEFEEKLEAMRLAANYQVDRVKQSLSSLRETFTRELEEAVEETNSHALDWQWWQPDMRSLAECLWHYDQSNPKSVRLFTFEAEKGDSPLQISMEVSLPSLSYFNYSSSTPFAVQLETVRRQSEQQEALLCAQESELDRLRVDNYKLAEEVAALKSQLSELQTELQTARTEKAQLLANLETQKRDTETMLAVRHSEECATLQSEIACLKGQLLSLEILAGETQFSVAKSRSLPIRKEHASVSRQQSAPAECTESSTVLARMTERHITFFDCRTCEWKHSLAIPKLVKFDQCSSYSLVDENRLFCCGGGMTLAGSGISLEGWKTAFMIILNSEQCIVDDLPPMKHTRVSPGVLHYDEAIFVFGCRL